MGSADHVFSEAYVVEVWIFLYVFHERRTLLVAFLERSKSQLDLSEQRIKACCVYFVFNFRARSSSFSQHLVPQSLHPVALKGLPGRRLRRQCRR
jgi:hypothetical protein